MRKFLLSILMSALVSMPLAAQWSVKGLSERSLFRITMNSDDGGHVGTGFCVPGRSSYVMTADHVVDGDALEVHDTQGTPHPVKAVFRHKDDDVALILLEDRPCEFSPIEFAKDSGEIGSPLWLVGYGGGFPKPILTKGYLSSEPGLVEEYPKDRLAQLNALGGHSGGPVFNSQNQIVGMLVGSWTALDVIDVIVPVEVLKKTLK